MEKKMLLIAFGVLAVVFLSASHLLEPGTVDFPDRRASLVVRNIGHKLLLYSGDSSSRILPVVKIVPGTFQLQFEHAFSFAPDTLVRIIRDNLAKESIPAGYDVSVIECKTGSVVYGFEVAPAKVDIIPCSGRVQPAGCYLIQIAFLNPAITEQKPYYYLFAFGGLLLIGFIGKGLLKRRISTAQVLPDNKVVVGTYHFYQQSRMLKNEAESIQLSEKESAILQILASRPNELVSRDQLLKEVWEDQGVFTGRSLDMFISKLRKKINKDHSVQITNVHGRGYKLESFVVGSV